MALGITLAKLIVPIEGKTDAFQSSIGKAQGLVTSFAGNVSKAGKVITTGLTVAAAGAATGIAALGGAMLKMASDAAPLVNVRAAFDGIAESVGSSGDAMLEAFDKATAGMVSHEDAMMSFNTAAQLVGTQFAQQLPDAMGYLGKVAAATGQDMGFMLDSLVKGVGRLSPMILDNLGIQVTLAEATDRAAEMYGKEADALSKTELQAGMMNVVLEKLAENTASMPDITQSAAAKMEQFKVALKNAKDQIGMALVPALGKLLNVFQPIIQKALPVIIKLFEEKLAPALEKVVGWIGMVVEIAFEFFNAMSKGANPIEALGEALWGLGVLEDIGKFLMAFGQQLEQTEGIAEAFSMALEAVGLDDLQAQFSEIQPYIEAVIDTISDIISTVWEWISQNVELQDVLIAVGILIAATVVPALISIVTAAAPIVLAIAAVIGIVALLRKVWEDHSEEIKAIAERVWGWLQTFIPQAIERVKEVVGNVLNAIKAWWDEHGEQVKATVAALWEALKTAFQVAIDVIRTIIETVLNAIKDFWDRHGEQVKALVDAFWNFIKTVYETVVGWIKDFIASFHSDDEGKWNKWKEVISTIIQVAWDIINQIFDLALDNLKVLFDIFSAIFEGDWEAVWTGIKTYFENIWNTIKGIAETVWDQISGAFDDFKRALQPIADAVMGFFDGIASTIDAISSAIQAAIGWIQSILDWLGQLLSIELPGWLTGHSPPPLANWLNDIAEAARLASEALGKELNYAVTAGAGLPNLASLPVNNNQDYSKTYNVTVATPGRSETELYDSIFILDGMI